MSLVGTGDDVDTDVLRTALIAVRWRTLVTLDEVLWATNFTGHDDTLVRMEVARVIASAHPTARAAVGPPLECLVLDERPLVRSLAVEAAARFPGAVAASTLATVLDRLDSRGRRRLVDAVNPKDPDGVRLLSAIASGDSSWSVRRAARRTVRQLSE